MSTIMRPRSIFRARRGRLLLLNARKLLEGSLGERKILIAIDDITERRRAAEALGDAKREAEQANLGKSRFLAAASHDLRQPLQTLSFLQGILAKKVTDKTVLGVDRPARRNGDGDVRDAGHAPRHQPARGRDRPPRDRRFPDQPRPRRAAQPVCLSRDGGSPRLARGPEQPERTQRSAAARADDPQPGFERGQIHRDGQGPARLPSLAATSCASRSGTPASAFRRSSFRRFSRSSISSTIPPASAARGSVSVSRSCNAWPICSGHAIDVRSRPGKGIGLYRRGAAGQRAIAAATPGSPEPGRGVAGHTRRRDDPHRRGRACRARDAEAAARRRRLSHGDRRRRPSGARSGDARGGTAGPRPRRLQSAQRPQRPPGRHEPAGDARPRHPGDHPQRRHLDRDAARDRPPGLRISRQAGDRADTASA